MSYQPAKRDRTFAVVILAALAVVAGILSFLDAARYMGWLPIATFGDMKFVLPQAQWFAAIMAAIVGVIFFVVASWLWNQNPSGWLFVVVITIFNLIFLFLAILGQTSFSDVLLQIAVNALALILALLPSTKQAFVPLPPSPEQVRAAAGKAAEKRTAAAGAAATAAAQRTQQTSASVGDAIADAGHDVADAAGDAVDAVGDAASATGKAVADAGRSAADAAGDAADAVGDAAGDAVDAVGDAVDAVGDATVDAAEGAVEAVEDAGQSVGEAVEEFVTRSGEVDIDLDTATAATIASTSLTEIEGIGPKISEALNAAGINTLGELAATPVETLRQILADAGIGADPATWPEQAALAAAGRMNELKDFQDRLEGGRKE